MHMNQIKDLNLKVQAPTPLLLLPSPCHTIVQRLKNGPTLRSTDTKSWNLWELTAIYLVSTNQIYATAVMTTS